MATRLKCSPCAAGAALQPPSRFSAEEVAPPSAQLKCQKCLERRPINAPVTIPSFLCKVSFSCSRIITPLHSLWAGLRTELQTGFWPKKTEFFERKLTERSARLDYVPVPWLLCTETFGTTPLPQNDFKWPELCS